MRANLRDPLDAVPRTAREAAAKRASAAVSAPREVHGHKTRRFYHRAPHAPIFPARSHPRVAAHAGVAARAMSELRRASDLPLPGGNFRLFATRLSFQAMISLGLIENPLTRTRSKNLANAQMLLDDLMMLRAKTAGNLEPDEHEHLEKVISDIEYALERAQEETGAPDDE
jgi:hypothetical protein